MRPVEVHGSVYGRVLTTVTATAVTAAVVATAATDDVGTALRLAPGAALAVWGVWALFWRPVVVVSDDGVLVRNVLRDVEIPWSALQAVQAGWSLVLRTSAGEHTVWAAPRASGVRGRRHDPDDGTLPAARAGRRLLPLPATAESVARAVEARRQAVAGDRGATPGARPDVRWAGTVVVPGLVLLALTLATALG